MKDPDKRQSQPTPQPQPQQSLKTTLLHWLILIVALTALIGGVMWLT
ncbi:hypothetical protein [Paracoccus siganidrum]|nr:hypothetical protein [Paracoccus siganidrum]